MTMMHRLLDTLNNVWNKQAKERPFIRLRRHNGPHGLATIKDGQLHLHTLSYRSSLPTKQSIVLDDLELAELIDLLEGMGYEVEVLPEAMDYLSESATTIAPFHNAAITGSGYTLQLFTSNVWRMLYPLTRLLEDVEGDIDRAVQQMFLRTASGKWLEYWASFFAVKRFIGESDGDLVKRVMTFLLNPKTNNRAMEELMQIVLHAEVTIRDVEPSIFEITIGSEMMTFTEDVEQLINMVKAGGVTYIYKYFKTYTESYNNYLYDAYGTPLRRIDGIPGGGVEIPTITEDFPTEDVTDGLHLTSEVTNYDEGLYAKILGEIVAEEAQFLFEEDFMDPWASLDMDMPPLPPGGGSYIPGRMFTLHISRLNGPDPLAKEGEGTYIDGGGGGGYVPPDLGGGPFTVHQSYLTGDDQLGTLSMRREAFRMVMTDAQGATVQIIEQ